jgi:hypothetical protein
LKNTEIIFKIIMTGKYCLRGVGGYPEHGKVLFGALKSFFRMQNLTKASTSLDSAHQQQLIATSFGANGPPGKEQSPFY